MTDSKDLLLAFREAGVGRKYDHFKLSEIPDAEIARIWVQNEMEYQLEAGKPVWVTGDDYLADVVSHCIVKSAVARDFRCRAMTLIDLRRELDEDDTDLFELDMLAMIDFDNPDVAQNPHPPGVVAGVEDTLMRMMRLGRTVLFHMSSEPTWWTPRLINEIARGNCKLIMLGGVK